MLESDDYHNYISNLRAVGCPEGVIRDIIVADLDDLYQRKASVAPAYEPPWLGVDHRRERTHDRTAKRFALQAEKRTLVKELLGYEWDSHANDIWNQDPVISAPLGFLPDMKATQVLSLAEKYHEAQVNVRENAQFVIKEQDHAKLEQVYRDWTTDVSRLLTPWEWDEYQLRVQAMRFFTTRDIRFDGVSIAGAQVREVARLSRSVKDLVKEEWSEEGKLSDTETARREGDFERGLKGLLGPVVFAEYQRAQEPDFRDAFQFTQEHQLSVAKAAEVFDARRTTEAQAAEVKADTLLSTDQRSAALVVLKEAAAKRLESALGEACASYRQGPGQWLEALAGPIAQPPGGQP
jgi:hypothetical protein